MKNDIYYSHQTPVELAKDLLQFITLEEGDVVLEPFCGEKAFYDNFPTNIVKEWTEVEEGRDYTTHEGMVDWCISNPPYRLETGVKRVNSFWIILNHFSDKVRKGMAFLINEKCFSALTPKRIKILNYKGLYLHKIITCSIKKWYGRYFFLIFKKEKCDFQKALDKTY
jgi:hypothetical protein